MTILEKIKIWCKLKPRRQVRIYSLLNHLADSLQKAGLSQRAEQIRNALYGSTSGEILDASAFALRQIRHSEKLPHQLKREIRMIEFAIWGLRHGLFSIALQKDRVTGPAAFCSTHTDAGLPLDYDKIIAAGGFRYGDFELMKCGNCGAFALYDNECCVIYLDAHDLSERFLYAISNQPPLYCPHCSARDAFDSAVSEDVDAICESEWAEFLNIDLLPFKMSKNMIELNVSQIKFFENKVVLSGIHDETSKFILSLTDDVSWVEFFSKDLSLKKVSVDRNYFHPVMLHDCSEKTITIIFKEYSFKFPRKLLSANDLENRKQILSYMYKFKKRLRTLGDKYKERRKDKYKSFSELPELLRKAICSELNPEEFVPNEIFVNEKYDELKNRTILEAMNAFEKTYGEETAINMVITKILSNPFRC